VWEVCEGRVIISKPNYWDYFIASKLTCEPCPFKVNKCKWLLGVPPMIDILKMIKIL